ARLALSASILQECRHAEAPAGRGAFHRRLRPRAGRGGPPANCRATPRTHPHAGTGERPRITRAQPARQSCVDQHQYPPAGVDRHTIPGQRRVLYRAAETPRNRAMAGISWRMRRTADVVREARANLPKEMAAANARLKRVEDYYEKMIAMIDTVVRDIERSNT